MPISQGRDNKKQKMNAVEVNDDDILHLNVGGQLKLSTTRSTLCQVEGSFLASMFGGRWESSHKRDDDGAVFLDYNPHFFIAILNYLRAKKFATPENPASFPKLPEDQVKDFKNFVEYLGLSDVVFAIFLSSEKFNVHSFGVILEEGGKVAVLGPDIECRYVLGENLYQNGIVSLKLKLESLKNNYWMFVGIVKGDVVPPDKHSERWPGSYGWELGRDGHHCSVGASVRHGNVWEDGSKTTDIALKNITEQSHTVELVLDCDAAKLSLHLRTGQQFHIEIPKSQTWRLNVNLNGANDKIRIVNE